MEDWRAKYFAVYVYFPRSMREEIFEKMKAEGFMQLSPFCRHVITKEIRK